MRLTGYHSCLAALLLVISAGVSEAYERCQLVGDPHLRTWQDGNKGPADYPCRFRATKTAKFPVDDLNNTFQMIVTTSSALETARGRFFIDTVEVVVCKFNGNTQEKLNLKVDRDTMEANLPVAGNPWTVALSLGSPFNSYVITSYDNSTGTATVLVTDSDGTPKVTVDFFPRLSPSGFGKHRGLRINVSDDALPEPEDSLFPRTACSVLNDTNWGDGETNFNTTDEIVVHGLISQFVVPQSRPECKLSFIAFHVTCSGDALRDVYFADCSPFYYSHRLVKCVDKAIAKNGSSYEAFGLCLMGKCGGSLSATQVAKYAAVQASNCSNIPS